MTTHISKELAEWLKERGCKISPSAHWTRWKVGILKHGGPAEPHLSNEWFIAENPAWWDERLQLPAYSWYDILVVHAKEFWGEEGYYDIKTGKFTGMTSITQIDVNRDGGKVYWNSQLEKTEHLLYLLQRNKIQEAEKYVKTHSLFANSQS